MSWLVPAENLDVRQKIAVGLAAHAPAVIAGVKLSGKTIALLHRAGRLRERFKPSRDHLRIWTATAELRDVLRSVARLFDIEQECIECYDDWCARVYCEAVDVQLPIEPLTGAIATGIVRTLARYAIQWGYAPRPTFEVLLVDEAEEFSAPDIAFMAGMAWHITLCAAFDRDVKEVAPLVQAIARDKPDIILTSNYRRNPLIAAFSAILRGDSAAESHAANHAERESLTYFPASDFHEEVVRLAEALRARMNRNESTGILVSDGRIGVSLAKELQAAGLSVEVQRESNAEFPTPNFSTRWPKVFTFERARGLNFETVALPCLNSRNFRGYCDDEVSELLAAGANLATRWVYLSSAKPSPLPQLDRLAELCRPDLLHIPGGRRSRTPPRPVQVPLTAIDDLL